MKMTTFITKMMYKVYPSMGILLILASCTKDEVATVVKAGEGGAAATGMSGGNVLVGIVVFVVLLLIAMGGGSGD